LNFIALSYFGLRSVWSLYPGVLSHLPCRAGRSLHFSNLMTVLQGSLQDSRSSPGIDGSNGLKRHAALAQLVADNQRAIAAANAQIASGGVPPPKPTRVSAATTPRFPSAISAPIASATAVLSAAARHSSFLKTRQSRVSAVDTASAIGASSLTPRSSAGFAGPMASPCQDADVAENALGRLALCNGEAVDIACRLVDLAAAKMQKMKLKEVHSAQAVVLIGRSDSPGDFRDRLMIEAFAKVWQDEVFEQAVQFLCSMHKLTHGKWNASSGIDYPGQKPGLEARFALHWSSPGVRGN